MKDCTADAYQDAELCNMIAEKTKIYSEKLRNKPYAVNPTNIFLLAAVNQYIIQSNNKININILDFGGACGAHYFEIRRFIPESIQLNWLVVETPRMVLSAKNMQLENDELKFYDSLELIDLPIDILHSSGTLQSVSDPYQYLDKLMNFNAKWIFFNRMMFNEENRDIIIVQKSRLSDNGPGPMPEKYTDRIVSYPHTTMSFEKFMNKLSGKYSVDWIFDENTGSFHVNDAKIIGKGLLCVRRGGNTA